MISRVVVGPRTYRSAAGGKNLSTGAGSPADAAGSAPERSLAPGLTAAACAGAETRFERWHVSNVATSASTAQEDPELANGFYGMKSKAPPHGQAGGRPGRQFRLPRPAPEEAPVPQPLDRAHQRRGAPARPAYSQLIIGLKAAGSDLDRKVLADIAVRDAEGFGGLAEAAKQALEAGRQAEDGLRRPLPRRPDGPDDERTARPERARTTAPRVRSGIAAGRRTAPPGRTCASALDRAQAGDHPLAPRPAPARCPPTTAAPTARRSTTLKEQVEARARRARRGARRPRARGASAAPPRVDVTLPGRRPALGSLHPVTLVSARSERSSRELGYSVAEGPEIEDDYHNFEAAQLPAGPSGARHAGHPVPEERLPAAHAHLAGADPHHAGAQAADPHHLPGPRLPQRQRPAALADVPPGRGPGGRRGDHRRATSRGRSRRSSRASSRPTRRSACARASSRSPSPRPRSTSPARSARATGCAICSQHRLDGDPRLRHGRSARARQLRHRSRPLLRLRLRHGGSTGWR